MNTCSTDYDFGTVQLDRDSRKILLKIINAAVKHSKFTPTGSVFLGKYVKGIRPNFIASDQELFRYLKELSLYLSKALELENPVLSIYGDLHSCFSVTWHEDKSSFCKNMMTDKIFFEEERRLLKFYIKLPLSYLDLSVLRHSRKYYLRSMSDQLSYFDVRCTHRTYISFPKIIGGPLSFLISDGINRILSVIIKRIGGINYPKSSNLYFLIYEDCPVFRQYEQRELVRANTQLS